VARGDWQRLQALVGTDPGAAQAVRWLGAEIDLAARDLSLPQTRALATSLGLDQTTADLRRPELILQAQAAMQINQVDTLNTVVQNLQRWLAARPKDALAWQWLASLYAAQNQSLRALRAEAEAQAARLDYAGALDRLKAAQEHVLASGASSTSASHIDASIVDTRLRQITALLKEQTLDH